MVLVVVVVLLRLGGGVRVVVVSQFEGRIDRRRRTVVGPRRGMDRVGGVQRHLADGRLRGIELDRRRRRRCFESLCCCCCYCRCVGVEGLWRRW